MTRDEFLFGLQAVKGEDETYVETDDGSIDFGSVSDEGRRCFEVYREGDAVQLWMTRDDLVDLQRKLTLLLLADA